MNYDNPYLIQIHANKLREYRHKLNLRQTDMAAIMGFEVIDRICHWERGRAVPGLINLIRLCVLFNAQPKELFPELYARIQEEIEQNRVTKRQGIP